MASEEEADLIARCLEGEVSAFEPLVDRYQKVLFNVALRMVRDYEEARDITQNAFLKAFEKLGTYDRRHKFFSWIYRILVNESLNALERRRPREALDPHLAAANGPLEAACASELSGRVQDALMVLSPDHRLVVVLRHFVGYSYGEMAEALAIPEKTVKSRLFTARQRLGEILLARQATGTA